MPTETTAGPVETERSRAALALVAPLLLAVVATAQLAVAQSTRLSPWKGGGFGMFSTVDAPDARFIRIYLIDRGERIPVLVPPQAEDVWVRARILPTQERLERIAAIVAGGTWIPYEFSRAQARYERLSEDPAAGGHHGSPGDDAPPAGTAITFEELALYRMVGEEEAAPPAEDVLRFEEVRLELWSYTFHSSPPRLNAERIDVVQIVPE